MKIIVQTQRVIIENIYLDVDDKQFNSAKDQAIALVTNNEFDESVAIEVDQSPREVQTTIQVSEEEYDTITRALIEE